MADHTQMAFRALADPTRRDIICMLSQSEMTISELTEQFDMTRSAVKKHLVILSEGNLITVEPRGRERVNKLNPAGITPVFDWLGFLDQFWSQKLHDLKSAIEGKDT